MGNTIITQKKGVGLYGGFSVLMFSYWAMVCSNAFHSTFIESMGMDSMQVGVIMAINYGVGMCSPPIWARFADKTKNIKGMLQLSVALMAIISLALAMTNGLKIGSLPLPILIFPLFFACYSASYSLLDSWTVKVGNQTGKITYAQIRLFGSLGYAIAAMLVSWLAGLTSVLAPYIVGFVVGMFVLVWSRGRQQPEYELVSDKAASGGFKAILKDRRMVVFMVFAFTINICLVSPSTYMPWVLDGIGANKTLVGSIGGFKALVESMVMLLGGRLIRKAKPTHILLAAGAFYIADQLSYLVAARLWQVFAIQLLEGAAYGLYLSCATQYVYNTAPKELTASAQSLLVVASFAGNIASNLMGGWIIGISGVNAFFTCTAVLMAAGVALLAFSQRRSTN